MAVVRLSGQLKDSIRNKVRDNYRRQAKLVTDECAKDNPAPLSLSEIYQMAISPYSAALNALPVDTLKAFVKQTSTVDVRVNIKGLGKEARYDLSSALGKNLTSLMPWPRESLITQAAPEGVQFHMDTGYMSGITISIRGDLPVVPTHATTDIAKLRDWAIAYTGHEEINTLAEQERKAITDCDVLLGQFATLAPLLKAWPQVWELLDESVKNRHREVTDRKTRRVAEEDLPDMSGVSSIIIANKLQNNSGGNDGN